MKTSIAFVLAATLVACKSNPDIPGSDLPVGPDVDGSNPDMDSSVPTIDGGTEAGESDAGPDAPITCGGDTFKCQVGESCSRDYDCASGVCGYKHACLPVEEKGCNFHFGGDTCGRGEVGTSGVQHESCCRSLPVPGFTDSAHPGKTVYLDKYEITAGRIRAFIKEVTRQMGRPDVELWVRANTPAIWDQSWSAFLPSDAEGKMITINRLLLGDPRHDGQTPEQAGPGVVLPPATDQTVSLGLNHQFGGQVYADVHGNNCGTYNGAYGFPTYYYPDAVQLANGEKPRVEGQDVLDVKSMNCITNAMLAAFCAFDGGQLATTDVMDYVAGNVNPSDDVSGCGTQYDNHGELLGNIFTHTVQTGGRCPDVNNINATFDAGDNLPVPGSLLNRHMYSFPDIGPGTSDKVWQIASPGRIAADAVRINQGDEPWMDLAGNLSESVYNPSTGRFGLRFRGIGYGSSRSDLNVTLMPGETILRVQRPEVKTALAGGRCMRFK